MHPNRLKPLILWLLKRIYRIECCGRENLESLKAHLEEGSAILCFNHLSFDDTIVLLAALLPGVEGKIAKMIIPFSRRHWGKPWGWFVRLTAPLLGLKVLPVVQHYEREKGIYPPEHIFSLDRRFAKAAHEVLETKGGMILLAPEGHRTETKRLQPPQKGVESLLKWVEKRGFATKVIPIGITPPKGYSRQINPGKRFTIHFGPLLSSEEIREQAQTFSLSPGEAIMREITQLITT